MKFARYSAVCLFALTLSPAWSQQSSPPVYKDSAAPITARVQDLLSKMTLEEKVAQLESQWHLPPSFAIGPMKAPTLVEGGHVNDEAAKEILGNGIGSYVFLDDFMGGTETPRDGVVVRNLMQHWVVEKTRLGIPILFHGEALHGAVRNGATSFPQAIALGSTWDPDLLQQMFTAVGAEARASGNALVLAPVLDLSRDPRYGRVQEMYSEDPYLVGQLGVAAVLGLQGDADRIDQDHVMATAKHFVHGQPENGTNVGPNDFSERTMRSVFFYPFEQVVEKANIGAVMPSYNENNGGIPSSENTWLLKEVLRKEWGFTGITASDYLAVTQLAILQHVAADVPAAGALALSSGVDMELPFPAAYPGLTAAVKAGKVSESDVNDAVARVLTAKFKTGVFDHPYSDPDRAAAVVGNKKDAELSRKVADEAVVLLKNANNVLPLDASKIKTLAVIGPNANKMRLGTYSGNPPYYVSVLDGITKRAGTGTKVVYAEGCRITEPDTSPSSNDFAPYQAPKEDVDRQLIKQAVETASSADVIVLVLGGNEVVSRESIGQMAPGIPPSYGDTDTLQLPGRQDELVSEIAKLGKPVIAVLLNGTPYAIEPLTQQAAAIVEGWYLGQETGNGIADVLFGDVNPSGHLPVTFARSVGQLPVYYYKTPAARRGYVFNDNSPLFPFGFGLSYTTFNFGKPAVDRETISASEKAKVTVTVTNSGSRSGDEVVQMYIHHPVSSVVQPVIALRGFKRVHLDAGQSMTISFEVGAEELSILNAQMKRTVELGAVDVLVGPSSAETNSVQITVSE